MYTHLSEEEALCDLSDEEIVRNAVEHGITDIFYEIQKCLGVTDGGFADIWWSARSDGPVTDVLHETFMEYIQRERAFNALDGLVNETPDVD